MSNKRFVFAPLLILFVLSCTAQGVAFAQLSEEPERKSLEMPIPDRGRVRAPELGGHRGWLNTERPLSLAALRGKVVLLDFWTYG